MFGSLVKKHHVQQSLIKRSNQDIHPYHMVGWFFQASKNNYSLNLVLNIFVFYLRNKFSIWFVWGNVHKFKIPIYIPYYRIHFCFPYFRKDTLILYFKIMQIPYSELIITIHFYFKLCF